MRATKKTIIMLTLAGMLVTANAFGAESSSGEQGRRRHGPPPEAFTACEGKSVGDTAEFVSQNGDTVTGTCEECPDGLVLRPDNPPDRGQRNQSQN